MDTKTCSSCKKSKPSDAFLHPTKGTEGKTCAECIEKRSVASSVDAAPRCVCGAQLRSKCRGHTGGQGRGACTWVPKCGAAVCNYHCASMHTKSCVRCVDTVQNKEIRVLLNAYQGDSALGQVRQHNKAVVAAARRQVGPMGAPVAMNEYIMTAPDDWPLDYGDEFCDVVVLDPTYSSGGQVRCSTTGAVLRRDGRMSEPNLVMHLKNISWKKGCNYRGCKRKLGAVVKEGPGRAATKMVRGMAEWEADLAGNRFHKDEDGNVRWSNVNSNAHLGGKYPSSVVCGFHARLKTQRSGDTAVRFADDVNRRELSEDASQVDRAHADAITEQAREAKRGPIIRELAARGLGDLSAAELREHLKTLGAEPSVALGAPPSEDELKQGLAAALEL